MSETNGSQIERLVEESTLSLKDKKELLDVISGERLADLYRDAIAKKAFSPDVHPDRLDFLLRRIMKDEGINVEKSASNEGMMLSKYSKKVITDIPAWLRDHRRMDLEVQAVAQEFIFTRMDIYSSNLLMVQYSAEEGQSKSEVDYNNVNGVIVVVLMVESPDVFKENKSNRYIHRVKKIVTDTGIERPALKQMAFVQLDKALELFLSGKYNNDEDVELLEFLAMIADINNEKVYEVTKGKSMFDDIRNEVAVFSKDKEVQAMLLEERMALSDWVSSQNSARRQGVEEGEERLSKLISALINDGDNDAIAKVTSDKQTREEYYSKYNI